MKKIVLIGKNGQLGSAIQEIFDKNEIELFAFDKNSLNILNEEQLNTALANIKPSIVINTSAFHKVSLCEEKPMEAFLLNCIAVRKLAQICNDKNARLITYSTDYIFDGTKRAPYGEDESPNPLQVYGLSKLAGEYAALSANPEKTYVIRTNGLYGGKTGSRSKGGNFILNILKDIAQQDSLEVTSEYFANPTSAIDLAGATYDLIKQDAVCGIYHLASEGYCSWYDFAKKILEYAKIKKVILPATKIEKLGKLQRPKFSVLANIKGKSIEIVLPTWEESLRKYIATL